MLKWLLNSLLVLVIFIPVATALPFASVALCRTSDGATAFFFMGPWSCCFLVLIYSTFSGIPWRLGGEAVRQHREAHGGLLAANLRATGWMFGGLFLSYAAEFLLLFLGRGADFNRMWLPLFTYSPLAFAWLWRRRCAG